MINANVESKRYVLFTDGMIEDMYDPRLWSGSFEATKEERARVHGTAVRIGHSPLNLFTDIVGVSSDGKFMPIAKGNWDKLFWIRHQFEYYLGYSTIDGNRGTFLSAKSKDGIMWSFNVIDC